MIIELLNGTRYDIENFSLKRLFHYIPSAEISHNYAEVDGRSDIVINTKINNRVIRAELIYISRDIFDYYAIRDEVNALFLRNESFYLIFKNEPNKRWLVKTNGQFELPPNMSMESFVVEFITINTYAETVGTTQTLKEWDVGSWAWDGTLNWDEELNYNFSSNNFVVKNLGNVVIDPREHSLVINVTGNFPDPMIIRNITTGDLYQYNMYIVGGDQLRLDGIRTLRNGVSDFRNTNRRVITLAPGDNQFSIEGGTVGNISFEFRFLYK